MNNLEKTHSAFHLHISSYKNNTKNKDKATIM